MNPNKLLGLGAAALLLCCTHSGVACAQEADVRPRSTPPEGPSPAPWFGGPGGADNRIGCPYIIGFTGMSGEFVDSLAVHCMTGAGSSLPMSGPIGGPGGGAFRDSCPPNYYATGVWGASGKYVDTFGLICRDLATATSRVFTYLHGGMGGAPFGYECPVNYHLDGLNIRSGQYIDAMQPTCSAD